MRKIMKSLVLEKPGKLILQERAVPIPGPTEILIRVKAAAICHTDFITMEGEHPGCKYPTVLGHEFSGIIEQCGQGVKHVKPGDRVTCLSGAYCGTCSFCRLGRFNRCLNFRDIPSDIDGAYQEMICVAAVMAYPFSNSLSFAEAALIEPAANGYSAVDKASIYPGEQVVIIGPGPIGLLALQAAKLKSPGSLTMLGTRWERLDLAAQLGATKVINVYETDPYQAIMDITGGSGADVVVLCAGTEEAWNLAGKILASEGRVSVEALPPTYKANWPVKVFDFTAKAISYLGISGFTPAQFETTLRLVESKKIEVAPLITHRFALEEYGEAFETSAKRKDGAIKVVFEMRS